MRIRRARTEDAAEVARLIRGTVRSINRKHYSQAQVDVWSNNHTAKRFRTAIDENHFYVAVQDGKIVGFGDFLKDGTFGGLYVHKNYQGKGAGSALLKRLESEALKRGVRQFSFDATITARDFYMLHGYKVVKRRLHAIKNQKLQVYLMEKKLRKNKS